ncbi:MAG: Holliday junction resolvase RuvX [Calditrichaeota bacterium]|nr:Holliday junction resolvase RuvX [Calditrichota bacterium]
MGVAVSDPMRIVAQGLETISYHSPEHLWQKMSEIFASYPIEKVIVGIPLNLNGSESEISVNAREFADQLHMKFHVSVELWDERYTSKAAHDTLHQMGKSPSKNKGKVDKIAAVLILQSYLDHLSTP